MSKNLYGGLDRIVISVPREDDPNLNPVLAPGTIKVSCDYCSCKCLLGPKMQDYVNGCQVEIVFVCMNCTESAFL